MSQSDRDQPRPGVGRCVGQNDRPNPEKHQGEGPDELGHARGKDSIQGDAPWVSGRQVCPGAFEIATPPPPPAHNADHGQERQMRLGRLCGWFILTCIVIAVAPACRHRGTMREPTASPHLAPAESRVDVIMGRTLVMPVTLEGAINPAKPIACRLDDGRKLSPALYWIGTTGPSAHSNSWVPEPGRWSATPASAGARPAGAGTWALVVDLPLDAIGQGIWLGTHRAALSWLPSRS